MKSIRVNFQTSGGRGGGGAGYGSVRNVRTNEMFK